MAKYSSDLHAFLEQKFEQYNHAKFIESDPIQIPKRFEKLQDIEIAGFFAAILAWGQRKTIINKCNMLMNLMDESPHEFCLNATEKDLKNLEHFKHRTFNGIDLKYFIGTLKTIYTNHSSLQSLFSHKDPITRITQFRTTFFSSPSHPKRTEKHISNPLTNSACKRLNMYLRWMVRDNIDFGLWKNISKSSLLCPLDVHSGRVARKLGLLSRKQNDLKACLELSENLKKYDAKDPIKYDIVLFSLGVFEKF